MRSLRASLGVVVAATIAAGVAGCGSTAKHVAESQLGIQSVRTVTPTVPSGDIATMNHIGADTREFIRGTGELLLGFQNGHPGTASALLRRVKSLTALDDDLWAADARLRDHKIKAGISPAVAALGSEATDLKQIGRALMSHDADAGNAAVRRLRTDFLKERAVALKLKTKGIAP